MNITIVIFILGFCFCGCYANPNRCVCVRNSEIPSPTQTGFDHDQVEKRLESLEILLPKKDQSSSSQLSTGGESRTLPRLRKNHLNYQKRRQNEFEIDEFSDTGNSIKEENILRTLLEFFEVPKRQEPKNSTFILRTGQLAPYAIRPINGKRRNELTDNTKTRAKKQMKTGFAFPHIIRTGKRFITPDIQLLQEYVREPNPNADETYEDYENEL